MVFYVKMVHKFCGKQKAQMKLFENLMVIIIFIFIVFIGFIFYAKFYNISAQKKLKQYSELDLIELGQRTPYVAELQCPSALEIENCIDLVKSQLFYNFSKNSTDNIIFYRELFGPTYLALHEIYPGNESIVIYESQGVFVNSRPVYVPISVYDFNGNIAFGMLEVRRLS